jgi:hypothetical protein
VKNINGKRFGKLLVVGIGKPRGVVKTWLCLCDCGNYKSIPTAHLTNGCTLSCGCIKHRRKGLSNDKFYMTWAGIIDRCENVNSKDYLGYGGRGIMMCEEWRSDFNTFREWALANYIKGGTIDRIDNDGPYCPNNCRFATKKQQANNRRNNVLYEHNGEMKTLSQWAEFYGIKVVTVRRRIRVGWLIEDALTLKNHTGKRCHQLKKSEK